MQLLQKQQQCFGLGGATRRNRALVTVRYQEDRSTGTQQPVSGSTPYTSRTYNSYSDDPAEALRAGWKNLKSEWNSWDPEDRNQALALGGGGLLVLYLANGLLNQVDRLPIIPQFLKLVGFAFSSWFFFRYLLYAEGREDLSKLSLDKLLGRVSEEATSDFSQAFSEGAEGVADAGNRIRKSSVGQAVSDDVNGTEGGSRLSDGSDTGYSRREVAGSVKSALRDFDEAADDIASR